jgi:hypothetical protein
MQWTIILGLSALGLLNSLLTIYGVYGSAGKWIGWLLFVVNLVVLGRYAKRKFFMHGFLTGLVSGLLGGMVMYLLYDTYLSNNPEIAEAFSKMPQSMDPKTQMMIWMPFGVAVSAVLLGLLTMLAGKFLGPKPVVEDLPAEPPVTDEAPKL